ncbi:unnamed protein product [Sphagnum troendelagicum]|uniref:Uncharacterized protein n=1 Tax=Sphagnum troendelagicum TaxID=128251 RepID=A0ABP0V4N4_9BRYO
MSRGEADSRNNNAGHPVRAAKHKERLEKRSCTKSVCTVPSYTSSNGDAGKKQEAGGIVMRRKFGEQQVCRKVAEESSVRKLSQRKDEVVQCRLYYTDAAEAAAFEPATCQQKAARVCYGAEDLQDKQVAAGRSDINARDFIMRRFLPAAQAMATEAPLTAAAARTTVVRESDCIPTSGRRSIPLLPLQQQLTVQQVANDMRGPAQVRQDSENLSLRTSCGFPLKLGWPPFRHLLGFQTSKSSSTKHHAPPSSSEKLPHDQRSFNSDDLFWSDEESLNKADDPKKPQETAPVTLITDLDLEGFPELKTAIESDTVRVVEISDGSKTEGFVEVRVPITRKHSMQTVHTPDHKGFLGIPRVSALNSDSEVKQVDRLGARLSHMISKSNYTEAHRHTQAAGDSHEKEEPTNGSPLPKSKKVVKGSALLTALKPPPSPISPSESWLSTRSIPQFRRPSRRPLGSFIPIKPPVPPGKKPSASESCKDLPRCGVLPPSCSFKDQLQHRQSISHTVQAV